MANPLIVIYCAITIKIICFSNDTNVVVLENGKEVKKKLEDTKVGDMVLVHDGDEKKYAEVYNNTKVEGKHEFFVIKVKNIKDEKKTKEIKVTGEHVMITYENKKDIKLVLAKNLEGNEYVETDDGLYQIYEINKEVRDNKYFLLVKGGVVYANGIFVSTICSNDKAKVLETTNEEWEKFQNED